MFRFFPGCQVLPVFNFWGNNSLFSAPFVEICREYRWSSEANSVAYRCFTAAANKLPISIIHTVVISHHRRRPACGGLLFRKRPQWVLSEWGTDSSESRLPPLAEWNMIIASIICLFYAVFSSIPTNNSRSNGISTNVFVDERWPSLGERNRYVTMANCGIRSPRIFF